MNDQLSAVLDGRSEWCILPSSCLPHLEDLPDLSVDHFITDPPYSEHVHSNQRQKPSDHPGQAQGKRLSHDLSFDSLSDDKRDQIVKEMSRLCRRWSLIFSDVDSAHLWRDQIQDEAMRHIRTGIWSHTGFWIKSNPLPQITGDRPASGCEAVVIAHSDIHGKRKMRWNGGGLPASWLFPIETRNRIHKTQKPLDLMLKLVEQFTDHGDLIVDPFCGSATMGVACLRMGRRFIGMEMDVSMAAQARARMQEEWDRYAFFRKT